VLRPFAALLTPLDGAFNPLAAGSFKNRTTCEYQAGRLASGELNSLSRAFDSVSCPPVAQVTIGVAPDFARTSQKTAEAALFPLPFT
ncbi:hypothetical protein AAEJ42_22750, partial [Shewanella algae]|uniref:hypothetical protein n=1 Tax=Shewanella algae TaxID=38313 RepID=UPI00313AB12A